jgi:adenylate cyclase
MTRIPDLSNPRLLAVLYADIHGYSGLVEKDAVRTIARLANALGLIRNLVGDYGGSVVNTAGDGLVAVFESPSQAVRFALQMQRELAREVSWAEGAEPLLYRIGIALGDTFAGEDGVYGHAVNVAARVQAFADPGGICITENLQQALHEHDDFHLQPLGARELKNIRAPVAIFAVEPLSVAPDRITPATPLTPPQPEIDIGEAPAGASVALMPMQNASGDPGDLYLCDGIIADTITNLSRFRHLAVIARHSSVIAAAQSSSLPEIGRRLGVGYLVLSTFRRSGNRLRLNVDLVEAASEKTVWCEHYDGVLGDIFEVQEDISARIASQLAWQIDTEEQRRLTARMHPLLYAYGLVLRGQDSGLRFRPDANLHSRRLFQQAREMDPNYARSYAALARTFMVEWRYNWSADPQFSLDQSLILAKDAVQCDPLDARGYSEMGLAYLYMKRQDEAIAVYERAVDLNPNDADLLAYMGDCLAYVRQGPRAVAMIQRAMRLNPYHPDSYLWFLGDAYFHNGNYAEAIGALKRMRDQSEAHRLFAASYALLGEQDLARHHAQEVMRVHPNFTIEHWRKVPPLQHPEDLDLYVKGLRTAGLR